MKHKEINTKGKNPLAILEELEPKEIVVSYDGDRISDHVREGNVIFTKNIHWSIHIKHVHIQYKLFVDCSLLDPSP